MQRIKGGWEAFKTIAILFSFIVNLVLIITLVIVGLLIFQIKNGIAEPLIDGLYGSFVGLDKATIDRVIPVRDEIPVQFILPLQQSTDVVLVEPVPLTASASFNLPGGGGTINGQVSLNLPAGMALPVALDLDVPVDTVIPVSLDVRAVIPMEETQLHDPLENLRGVLEPFVRALDNLPGDGVEGREFLTEVISGNGPDLLAPTDGSQRPWPGYSRTAGEGYEWPLDSPPQPGSGTGVVPGGLSQWGVPPGADDGIYIPYGVIGPAGIIPAGNELIGPNSPSMAYPATMDGVNNVLPAQPVPVQPAGESAGGAEGSGEPSGDLGIITPPPPQQ